MIQNFAIGEKLFIPSVVRPLHCRDPYSEWCCGQDESTGSVVWVQLFWRRVPLQKDAVQAIVRATAAGVMRWLDQWELAPVRPWLSAARSLVGAGLLPIPEDYEPPAHLRDFRRLLPHHRFHIRVGVDKKANAPDQDLRELERLLQWACDLLQADALLLLASGEEAQPLADNDTGLAEPEIAEPEPEIVAPPLQGKPHPLSESEQKLARAIAADSLLAPLFAFNAPVRLGPVSQPCVDLLWNAGKLVIEIDDATHWHKIKYAADRQRDFELMASGYLVLRITAEEVLRDLAKALSKIRTCVELRR
jgi:very-short-patch-repair endonuclease